MSRLLVLAFLEFDFVSFLQVSLCYFKVSFVWDASSSLILDFSRVPQILYIFLFYSLQDPIPLDVIDKTV